MDCIRRLIRIKADASGFRTEETKDVVLGVSQHTSVDLTLQVAGLQNSVTVIEAAPMLETGDSALGTTITGQYTRDMPLYGRSYFGLVFLAPRHHRIRGQRNPG